MMDNEYQTKSKAFADDLMRLTIHAGISATIVKMYDTYVVTIVHDSEPVIEGKQCSMYWYEDSVYCLQVPSHVFMVRQNMKNMWSGNCSRKAQKGTCGIVYSQEDMPFTKEGIVPDLIINPHAFPKRMTIGQLIECLFGKACAAYGAYGDCTAYATKGSNAKTYGEMLTKMDFHSSGNQLLYNGYTGEQIYSEIFIGPTYYMRLKHMVKDKINYRATGRRSALTRQTNQGRANDGGLRIGEMERDGIMGHGLSYFLNESYMVRGDQYYMAVCNKTGMIAIYNPNKNLFLSPMSDGPLKFNRTSEGEPILDVFSRFGRSFSLLRVPYALKLLIQELQVMNVQMRIITEENVDQLLNLSYQSKNLNKLMNVSDTDFKDMNALVTQYKNQINDKMSKSSNEAMLKRNNNAALIMNIQEVEPQKFNGIDIQVNPQAQNFDEKEKWDQYPELKHLLLSMAGTSLVEHTYNDNYWGDGGDGSGLNRLGDLLVELRETYLHDKQA
jgi:predicted NAD-dependent protein-ADP-ribosyltransferase YbiA (DUF1768 family)